VATKNSTIEAIKIAGRLRDGDANASQRIFRVVGIDHLDLRVGERLALGVCTLKNLVLRNVL
jgi:hypothetical protein